MHIIHRSLLLILSLSLLYLAQGCAPVIKQEQKQPAQPADLVLQARVAALIEAEDYAAAAELLESTAQLSDSPERESLYLDAAEIWSEVGEWDKVEALLLLLKPPLLSDELVVRRRLLQAELALSQRDLDLAFDLLQPPPSPESPVSLRQRYHKIMAEFFRLTGNLLESARELVELDSLLQGSDAQLANQKVLVQTLSTMTDTALALLQPKPPGALGGWMELVRILKRKSEDPTNFEPHIEAWREDFSDHSALPELLSDYYELQVIDRSSHVAVLLPQSGPYIKVAAAVRDGFLAAWYQQPAEKRPALRFYDSSDPEQIVALYQQAVLQGAHMIVGPLAKKAVTRLQASKNLHIPILALNQAERNTHPTPNLFQFALSPEDEAEQIAERAWLEGHSTALVLSPGDDWGNRLYRSFRERWQSLGGTLLEHQAYAANGNDFSRPIRQLLNIDESEARKQALQRIIGVPMEADPRPRADAHFIFLAARAQKGRQLRPQLNFHHAGNLPVFATSHIYNSAADSEKDKDLGYIKFVDTPWLLEENSQSKLSRDQLGKLIPDVRGHYARLYAMGIDAFSLLSHLQLMVRQTGSVLHGKTGNLYLDGFNRLHRQLAWAEMKRGVVSITGYAPRLENPTSGYQDKAAQMTTPSVAGSPKGTHPLPRDEPPVPTPGR
jgi:outer membrane PBP1 activator LpoA protein